MQMMNALNKAWCLHVPHLKIRLCGVIRCEWGGGGGGERVCMCTKRGSKREREREFVCACMCVSFPLWAYAEMVSMQSHYWETHQEDENKLYCSTKWQTATIKGDLQWEGNSRVLFVPPFLKMVKCLFTVVDSLWCLSIFAHNGMPANLLRRFNTIYLINVNANTNY